MACRCGGLMGGAGPRSGQAGRHSPPAARRRAPPRDRSRWSTRVVGAPRKHPPPLPDSQPPARSRGRGLVRRSGSPAHGTSRPRLLRPCLALGAMCQAPCPASNPPHRRPAPRGPHPDVALHAVHEVDPPEDFLEASGLNERRDDLRDGRGRSVRQVGASSAAEHARFLRRGGVWFWITWCFVGESQTRRKGFNKLLRHRPGVCS